MVAITAGMVKNRRTETGAAISVTWLICSEHGGAVGLRALGGCQVDSAKGSPYQESNVAWVSSLSSLVPYNTMTPRRLLITII
jgi:hypothetical protein